MNATESNNTSSLWHTLSAEDTIHRLNSSAGGISEEDARIRRGRYGQNSLPQRQQPSLLRRILSQFNNVLIYVLLICALITASLGHWVDSGVILAVVLVNAIIGFLQESKAEKAMEAIRYLLAPTASIMRNGTRTSIQGELLVPGDIVLLEAGDKVPADLRLLNTHSLTIQEAILTGESVPVEKATAPVAQKTLLGERSCMAYSGTLVTHGQAKGIVVSTGMQTEIGRISKLLAETESLTTPLVQQIGVFARWLSAFILAIAALMTVYGYIFGHHTFVEIFMAVVGFSVAAIPEGLPATLTITLSVGAQAMARRNAVIRRLPAIETLGSVSVICTDKTGTLTRNEMVVVSVISNQNLFTVNGNGYNPHGSLHQNGTPVSPTEHAIIQEIARAATLCNDAALYEKKGVWHIEGDPMEGALLSFAFKMKIDIKKELAWWKRTDAIPFDSTHRFMATLNHDHKQQAFIFVKGAPERIIPMCKNQQGTDGTTEQLNVTYWENQIETIASSGQRVLALAVKPVQPQYTVLQLPDIEGELTLVGMIGLFDPPRAGVIEAIAECKKAGIRVMMVTGDHAKTAAAIGKQIGLEKYDRVITGADLDAMDSNALHQTILESDIFARTSPKHKLLLVKTLQSQNFTVAMTGDGVNDAPALKRADVGIAMGKKGSEAAKESAELVLIDDNFASIVAAIQEGRTVYDNIKKTIGWTLPTNASEAAVIIVALLLGMTLPITPVQILWVNLITTITLGIALAFEPMEPGTMQRPPRDRTEPLVNKGLIWHIVLVTTLFICGVYGIYCYALGRNYSLPVARTLAVNTLVFMEIFHMFFIRNIYGTKLTWQSFRGTKVVWLVTAIIVTAQLAITYTPILQKTFATARVPLKEACLVVAIGVALFIIIETEKRIRTSFRKTKKT